MRLDFFRRLGAERPSWRVSLVASVGAIVVTAVAWWGYYLPVLYPYTLEVSIQSAAPAATQVYFERGTGLRESDSSSQRISEGTTLVRLPLPAGNYRALRFDPIDRGGTVKFGELRILSRRGAVVHRVAPDQLSPNQQIQQSSVTDGWLVMTSTSDANDPQYSVQFDPPLELAFTTVDQLIAGWSWLLRWFVGTVLVLLLIENTWRHRTTRFQGFVRLSRDRPQLALALFAAFTAVLSSYPVVFFGKSFVSPNTTHLLYDALPSVPGYSDVQVEKPRGADIGAMMWQHFPYTVQQSAALKAGELPLWNRFSSGGLPLLGQGQSMLGDPLQFLVILTGGASWAFDLKFLLAKALFACGLGWCVWAMTRDFAASAILVLASGFIAFFNYRQCHPSIFTIGYAPWILVAWFQLRGAMDGRAFRTALVIWFVANWMVITSGTVKEAYMLIASLNVTGALIFLGSALPRSEKVRRGVLIAVSCVAFALTSAPLWWSFVRSLASAYTAYDVPGIGQIPGVRLVGLFDDVFYREFMPEYAVFKPASNFLILLGCICALAQARRLWNDRAALIIVFMTLGSITLAFQFGPSALISAWLLKIPFIRNIYNLDTIFSCIAIVHLCLLAGWGFAAARRSLATGHLRQLGCALAATCLVLFTAYFAADSSYPLPKHEWPDWSELTTNQAVVYAHALLLPLCAGVLLVLAGRSLQGRPLSGPNAVLAAGALLVLLGRHGQHLAFFQSTFIAVPSARADLTQTSPAIRFLQEEVRREPARVLGSGRNLFAGVPSIHGLEQITGANALENRWHRQLVDAAGLVPFGQWIYDLPVNERERWQPIADFLNSKYLATPPNVLESEQGYRKRASLDFEIFESVQVWPRAFFTPSLDRYNEPGDLVRLIRQRAGTGPFAAIQSGEEVPLNVASAPGGSSPAVAGSSYVLGTNRTAFTIEAPTAGMAVLHENWLPADFQATLNGEPVPYYRVNHAFKAVAIPDAGKYRIEFTYWPRGFTRSLIASLVGLALGAVALLASGRRDAAKATILDPAHVR